MKRILKEASNNFGQSLGLEFVECDDKNIKGYVSEIEIRGDKNYDVYVVLPKEKLEKVSEIFFGDKNDYDLEDLTKEIANLIVGNSKVIAYDRNISYDISTPKFLGEYKDISYDDMVCLEHNGVRFYILLKEIS